MRHLAVVLLMLASTARPAPAREAVFVDRGELKLVAYQRKPWVRGGDYVQGRGAADELYAGRGIGAGDFHIRARLRIVAMRRSAAACQPSFMPNCSNISFTRSSSASRAYCR